MRNNVEVVYRPTVEQKPLEDVIANDIRNVRDAFLNREPNEQNAQLTYDPMLDIAVYQTVNKYRATESPAYKNAIDSLNNYTHFQLETTAGELCNVLSGEYILTIHPEGLYSPKYKGLLLEMMKRGRDYRRNQGSKVREREDAEVEGFEKVTEPILMDPNTKEGESVASISRPKGPYTKNFYDVFTVIGSGVNRYVRVRRYSSGLSMQDYIDKIPQLGISYEIPSNPTDAFFLSHPIRIGASSKYSNPDTLHAFFHKEHSYMNRRDFEKVKEAIHPLFDSYILTLQNNPHDIDTIAKKFNTVVNATAQAKKIIEEKKKRERMIGATMTSPLINDRIIFYAHDILRFQRQKVRPEMTGCGILIGFKKGGDSMNPFDDLLKTLRPDSVADFASGTDDLGDRKFSCPVCGYTNERPYNQTIQLCQNENCSDRTKVSC